MTRVGRNGDNAVDCTAHVSHSKDLEKMSCSMHCPDVNYHSHGYLNQVDGKQGVWTFRKHDDYGNMKGGPTSEENGTVLMTCNRQDDEEHIIFDCTGYSSVSMDNLSQPTEYHRLVTFTKNLDTITVVGKMDGHEVYNSHWWLL